MFHYFGTTQNTNGDALPGWFVEVISLTDGTVIPIYADEGGTPIANVSGETNRAKSDEDGNYDFFVADGDYSLKFYNSAGTFQKTQRYLPMYGNLSGAIADGLAQIDASKDAAVSSGASAATSATTATTQATASASSATASATSAAQALQAATIAQGFCNTLSAAASALPFEVTAISGGVGTGTGGTNGVYNLGVTGGPAGFKATVTISGGAIAGYTIVNPGISTSNTAPTLSLSGVTGLTGATTPTATVGTIPVNRVFLAPSGSGQSVLAWINNAGSLSQYPTTGTQFSFPTSTAISTLNTAATRWVRQGPSTAPLTTGTIYSPTTGAGSANASYQAVTLALTGAELGLRATGRTSSASGALACYYDVSDVFISSQFTGTGSPTLYTNQVLTPPANARKVIICGLIAGGTVGIDVLTVRDLGTTATQASLGNAAATSLASWTDSGSSVVTGSYINAFGAVVATGGFQYLDYTITANDIAFRATGTENGASTQLACYVDGNGQALGTQFTGTSSIVAYTNQDLTIPEGTVKIRLSGTTGGSLSLSIRKVSSTAAADIVAAANNATRGNAAAATLDTWQASGGTAVVGSYINASGNPVVTAGYQYLDYTVDGSESAFRLTSSIIGAATQAAIYLSASGAVLGRDYIGTGSVVVVGPNQTLTVPTGTRTIRVCGQSGATLDLSVKKPLANAATLIQNGSGNTSISVFGDSTALALAPFIATNNPTRLVYNEGIGGQTTQQVAARMGAMQVTCVGAVTLPTSGTVGVTPSIDLLFSNRSTAWSCRVMVMGIECWLVCAATTGAYTLKPVTYPANALTVPSGTNIVPISGAVAGADPSAEVLLKTMLSGTVVIRTSRNDTALISGGAGRATVLGYMQAMVTQVAAYGGNLLLMTGINGTIDMPASSGLPGAVQADAATSDLRLSSIATLNASIMSTWPNVAIDPLANHVMRGGSTNQTPVSTTYAVLNSTVLSTDGLHENSATGYPQTATFVQSFITSRGY